MSQSIRACAIGTVRAYLTNRAVMAGPDYGLGPDGAVGIQWENTYNCPPGNIRLIHVPLLVMGMTGSYEYLASEAVYQNAASRDKSIAFVEGAFGGVHESFENAVAKGAVRALALNAAARLAG